MYTQGGKKDRRGNKLVGSYAMYDARCTGPRELLGKKIEKWRIKAKLCNTYKSSLVRMNSKTLFVAVW